MKDNMIKRAYYHFAIHNRYARRLERRSRIYRRLEKKYQHILEAGVEPEAGKSPSSNYVWVCWFQGLEQAPPLVKACVSSLQKNMPDREIIILTEETIPKYVEFPDYIVKKREQGIISAAHYSDLLRTELLCRYGGMWIDSTVLCTSNNIPSYITEAPLFVYKQLDLSRQDDTAILSSSWFISAQAGEPILEMTRKLLYEYWKDYNYLIEYFLFHLFFGMAARKYKKEWDEIPFFNNHSPHILQFELDKDFNEARWEQLCGMSVFHKLNRYHSFADKPDSMYMHILRTFR